MDMKYASGVSLERSHSGMAIAAKRSQRQTLRMPNAQGEAPERHRENLTAHSSEGAPFSLVSQQLLTRQCLTGSAVRAPHFKR
jgi:hypothetical protein